MSHEIRTPMNGVLGVTELLLEAPHDPEQRHYLGMIRSSAESPSRMSSVGQRSELPGSRRRGSK